MSRPLQSFGSSDNGSSVALKRRLLRKAFNSNNVYYNGVIVAKSTMHGTPVKSCMMTRAGVN